MNATDFYVEFYSQADEMSDALKDETRTKLEKLADKHNDLLGASVAVEYLDKGERKHLFRVRIVLFRKMKNLDATKQGEGLELTVREALDALERQVREERDKVQRPWEKNPGKYHGI